MLSIVLILLVTIVAIEVLTYNTPARRVIEVLKVNLCCSGIPFSQEYIVLSAPGGYASVKLWNVGPNVLVPAVAESPEYIR